MIDVLVQHATIVDGRGGPSFRGDVAIAGGRVVAVAPDVDEPATRRIDADGLVAAPGFIDPHTHFDAQVFWDGQLTPSSNHGVTTVIAGNCGFTLAPLRAADADFTRRMMARVEGMSLAALEAGVPWGWESFAEYLDAVEGRTALHIGFLVGHCALRRYVMGEAA
jgi:N-acyl-D-aspartate/D-glutamate deacylase